MIKKMMLIVLFYGVMVNLINANGENAEKNDELYKVQRVVERELNFEEIQKIKKLTFEDMMTSEVYIEFQLFKKVFPDVELIIQTSFITRPPRRRLVAKYRDNYHGMPLAFNILSDHSKNETTASAEDRIRIYFKCKSISTELTNGNVMGRKIKTYEFKIISIEKEEKKANEKGIIHDYKYKVQVIYDKEIIDYLFYIENDCIKHIEFLKDGKYDGSSPISQPKKKDDKQSRTIHFSADGINVVQDTVITPTDTYVHYYIKVSENGIATNDTIKIQVTGLTPLHPNTKLQIEPLYGYGGILVLDQLLVVDSLGTASYTWTPPNNDQTGFMEVKVNISGTDTYWDLTYIIPEHSKTGTFTSGYDYTIYYCNQFFAGQPPNPLFPPHPSGIAHAYTFAGYVENAVTESWINQVNDWELAFGCPGDQPTDYDGNYEIFINDSDEENSYHGTYGTYQEPGLERKIYNIVPFKDRIEFIKWHKIREEK